MTSVMRTISAVVRIGRFCWRQRWLILALAVGLLIVAPLLTGGGGTFFLNLVSSTGQVLVGLGTVALVVRRIVQARKRRKAAAARNTRR